jgi:hypothetical protein
MAYILWGLLPGEPEHALYYVIGSTNKERSMYEISAQMIDDTCCQVRVTASNSMYVEVGDVWNMQELDQFCEREMIDLVIF